MSNKRSRLEYEVDSERIVKQQGSIIYDGGDKFNSHPDISGKTDEAKNVLNAYFFLGETSPKMLNGGNADYCIDLYALVVYAGIFTAEQITEEKNRKVLHRRFQTHYEPSCLTIKPGRNVLYQYHLTIEAAHKGLMKLNDGNPSKGDYWATC